MINSFTGDYFFLSNFYEVPITIDNITYFNSEAAFQAQKTLSNEERIKFAILNPSEAKRKGRRIKLRDDWEEIKFEKMYNIVSAKFQQNEILKDKLLATSHEYLEEGNTWGDRIWGTVNGKGLNYLGKILMKVREELRENKYTVPIIFLNEVELGPEYNKGE